MSQAEETPKTEEPLIPPCVSDYRFNMGRKQHLRIEQIPVADGIFQRTVCTGEADPWCAGGSIDGGPDGTIAQTDFTEAMGRICTARCWYRRTNNGQTILVEKIGE